MESTTASSTEDIFPPVVERLLLIMLMTIVYTMIFCFFLTVILAVAAFFVLLYRVIWTSGRLNTVKQSVREALNSILQNLKARSSSRNNEISAKMREIEAALARNTALLLEVKAKVRCVRLPYGMSCLFYTAIAVPVCICLTNAFQDGRNGQAGSWLRPRRLKGIEPAPTVKRTTTECSARLHIPTLGETGRVRIEIVLDQHWKQSYFIGSSRVPGNPIWVQN